MLFILVLLIQPQIALVCPPGAYTVTTPSPTTITYTASSITFSWGQIPGPPIPPMPPIPPAPPAPPAPIPIPGIRVLIIYESSDLTNYPPAQVKILYDQDLRIYLDSITILGNDQKTHEWRFWDQHVDLSNVTQLWKDVMARPRSQLPWIVISNGVTGFEGPLPANTADTIALIKKHVVPQ